MNCDIFIVLITLFSSETGILLLIFYCDTEQGIEVNKNQNQFKYYIQII
jgi:hypothetical protein